MMLMMLMMMMLMLMMTMLVYYTMTSQMHSNSMVCYSTLNFVPKMAAIMDVQYVSSQEESLSHLSQ